MIKFAVTSLVCTLILITAGAGVTWCQELEKPELLPVYIVDFSQESQRVSVPRELADLNTFTSSLIYLRLLEASSATLQRVPVAPVCDSESSKQDQAINQPPPGSPPPVIPSGNFYVVHGSIEIHMPDIVMSYIVEKCDNHKIKKLYEGVEPVTLDHALDEMASSAHAIAFVIERDIPPTKIAVGPFGGDVNSQDQQDIITAARKDVIESISQSSSYTVIDKSDYLVGGQITFSKNRKFIGTFSNTSILQANLRINAHGKSYPLNPVVGSSDQLKKFYADIDAEVLRGLPQVLLAEHLQLPDVASHMGADALLAQAQQILNQCPDAGECAGAQDAIQLLSPAAQKDTRAWKVLVTLGRAQMRAGKGVDAVNSLQKATDLIKEDTAAGGHISTKDQFDAMNLLGDSYRGIGEYSKAEDSYSNALKLDPAQLALYRSKAIAQQFDNKRILALQTLIDGLKLPGSADDKKPLHETAEDVVRTLQPAELDAAEALLDQTYLSDPSVANEYALVISQKWEHIFDTSWTADNRVKGRAALKVARDRHPDDPSILVSIYGDSAIAERVDGESGRQMAFIQEAQKQSTSQVPAYLRSWLYRLQAVAESGDGKYENALDSADKAYHLQPTDYGGYLLADTGWLAARCRELKLKSPAEGRDQQECSFDVLTESADKTLPGTLSEIEKRELKERYQQIVEKAAPLVAKRYFPADTIFMWANHSLDQDKVSLTQFQQLIQRNPKDESALRQVQHICSQYIFDFECSFAAAQKRAALLTSNSGASAGNYLDVTEAAILKGDFKTAESWLASATKLAHTSRERTLCDFLQMWIAMRLNRTNEYKSDFDVWRDATAQLRNDKTGTHWNFFGAEKSINDSKAEMGRENTEFLLAMIKALMDDKLPLPIWPVSAAHS